MKIIEQSHEILNISKNPLETIELAGRTCYQSTQKGSTEKFIKMIIDNGHESVLEHASATIRFITDRGVSHELVRHRIASYSQESTRYCNYGGKEMEFIKPVWSDVKPGIYDNEYLTKFCKEPVFKDSPDRLWFWNMAIAEDFYNKLLKRGWRPEQARSNLPNSLKTEIVVTMNFRELRHMFKLRCSNKAHPQIRELMSPCLREFHELFPAIFIDPALIGEINVNIMPCSC